MKSDFKLVIYRCYSPWHSRTGWYTFSHMRVLWWSDDLYGYVSHPDMWIMTVQCWWVKRSLEWRHNGIDSVSNHQPHDCLLNRLFRRRSKQTSKLRVSSLCEGNSPGTGEFPSQMASSAGNCSIWWRHHITKACWEKKSKGEFCMKCQRDTFINHLIKAPQVWKYLNSFTWRYCFIHSKGKAKWTPF